MCTRYLREVRRGHGKGHHGLHWLLLRVKWKLRVVICAVLNSSLVGSARFVLETLVSIATSLAAIKVGLSIVSPIKAIIAVPIVIAGSTTVRCPVLCRTTKGFLWSVIITAIVAATVLAVVIVPPASRITIPAIISIPATSTAP